MELKDKIDLGAKVVTIIGGLIAACKILIELRLNRKQRAQELRWKQSNSARELIREMLSSKLAHNVTIMFD